MKEKVVVRWAWVAGLLLLWQGATWGENAATAPAVSGGAAASQPAEVRSKAVEKNGLSVTVKMPKARFAADEPLKFTVVYKNVSKAGMVLWDTELAMGWRLLFWDERMGGEWLYHLRMQPSRTEPVPTVLKAGEILEVPAVIDWADKGVFEFVWQGKEFVPAINRLQPGTYRLTIGMKLEQPVNLTGVYVWFGTLTTEPVEFAIEEKAAAPVKAGKKADG